MREPVTFFARRGVRWGSWINAALGLLLTVLAVTRLLAGDRSLFFWFFLVVGPLQVVYYLWFASRVHRPVVRITDEQVILRPVGSKTAAVVERADVVGLRWQDTFDLRLCLRSGVEHSIHMRQIARRDRPRLQALLQEIAG